MTHRTPDVTGAARVPFQAQGGEAVAAPRVRVREHDRIEVAPGQDGDCLSTLTGFIGNCLASILSCLRSLGERLGLISAQQPRGAEEARPEQSLRQLSANPRQSDLTQLSTFIERWITSPSGPLDAAAGMEILQEFHALAADVQKAVRDSVYSRNKAWIDEKAIDFAIMAMAWESPERAFNAKARATREAAKARISEEHIVLAVEAFIETQPLDESTIEVLNRKAQRLQ